MSNWILVVLLGVQAHFAASYLVPLKQEDQGLFGGLLRWFWPWADGDAGLLGRITLDAEPASPLPGLFLAMTTGTLFVLAALAAAGVWVPGGWWRPLAIAGSALLLGLMALFFGPTKLIPMAFALGTLYIALARPQLFATG